MQNPKLEKCITELNKPNANRNLEIIINHLKTLEPLMALIKEKYENNEEVIKKLSSLMIYQKSKKNDIIFEYGEKINDLHLILSGNVNILAPKFKEYYMDKTEFIIYLLKLRKYNQKELLNQCIKLNASNFSLTYDFLSTFLFNLGKKKIKIESFFQNEKIINETKAVINYLRLKGNINNKLVKNISLETFTSFSEIDKKTKIITEKIKNSAEKNAEDKKLVKLPDYEQISLLKEGEIFGDNIIEYTNNKMRETAIALSDCDLVKINKLQFNDLMKISLARIKNKIFTLILSYKIFTNIPYATFDKKYYKHLKSFKLNNNQILFKEGDFCDKIYFISNGEYEIYIDKNIQEINDIILRLKNIVDDSKKYILAERRKIIDNNMLKKNIYLKLKNNLNQFFEKFENEINLEEVAFNIKHQELKLKRQFLENKPNNIYLIKRRIKLGIFKNRQIIGLNDLINREEGNICIFNCKCHSFEGELLYFPYNKFKSMYETEDKVKLYSNELLFQNIYYIIERLLSHKKFIIDEATKKENDIGNIFSDVDNKISRNKITNKAKINVVNIIKNIKYEDTKNSNINYSNNNNDNDKILDSKFKRIASYFNNDSHSSNRINNQSNRIKIKKDILQHNLSDNKIKDKEEVNNDSTLIKNTSKNTNKNSNIKNEHNSKSPKFNNELYSRNVLPNEPLTKKNTKNNGMNTVNTNVKMDIPILVINNKEVKVKEDLKDIQDINNKTSYINYLKYVNNLKDDRMNELINNNELKNIILFGNYSEKIEKKLNLKLLQKTKNLLLRRNRIKKSPENKRNIFDINNYNLQITPYNSENKTPKNINQSSKNNLNKNTSRNYNKINPDKREPMKFEKKVKNIIFNRSDQFSFDRSFKKYKNAHSNSQRLFFKNVFLKKNLSDFPFLNNSNSRDKNNMNYFESNIRNNLSPFKNLRKKRNKFIQTPKTFMNSFNAFKKKMEKLNVILK